MFINDEDCFHIEILDDFQFSGASSYLKKFEIISLKATKLRNIPRKNVWKIGK